MKTRNFPAAVTIRREGALERLIKEGGYHNPNYKGCEHEISVLQSRISSDSRARRTKKVRLEKKQK